MTGLLKKLKFAIQYDFTPEFMVFPYGERYLVKRFVKYEDAKEYAKETQKNQPMYPEPEVLLIVRTSDV